MTQKNDYLELKHEQLIEKLNEQQEEINRLQRRNKILEKKIKKLKITTQELGSEIEQLDIETAAKITLKQEIRELEREPEVTRCECGGVLDFIVLPFGKTYTICLSCDRRKTIKG